ncbi:hypothetical protein AAFP30_20985 [Gordonia sp. CPCC 205515]|uniref:hypothetical protein n=1 Tax=Gordonia sp. CPCC 205515 TaxID=3140791 RepID=UPI003AF34430
MCRVSTPLTRRAVLRGGLVITAGTVAASVVAACDRGPTPEQVTAAALVPLADSALADQYAAQQLSPQSAEYSAALGVVATQRGDHARALREEITRLDQETANRITDPAVASTSASASVAPGATSTSPAPAPAPTTVSALRTQLTASARAAGDAAVSLNGYPAGLAGSIGASVTSMVEVQLG